MGRVPGSLCSGLLAIAIAVSAQPPGDVDGNGFVLGSDAALLADHLTGSTVLTPAQLVRADCNGESGIDCADIVWIINNQAANVPEMVSVPAGAFEMGDPWGEGYENQLPVHTVSLSAYEIGRHEVTNAECAAFLNSAGVTVTNGVVFHSNGINPLFCTYSATNPESQIEFNGRVFSVRTRDTHSMNDHPVVEVSWYGAAAYCNWLSRQHDFQEVYTEAGDWPSDLSRDGYHLPTEAQWERAAAWDPDHGHWRYGFRSDWIDFSRANHWDLSLGFANPLDLTEHPHTAPVGFYSGATTSRTGPTVNSPSQVGCYDMSGNVEEWCNDWYSSTYYSSSPGTNPEGPSSGPDRVVRGGSWGISEDACRSAHRDWSIPHSESFHRGFRVARSP